MIVNETHTYTFLFMIVVVIFTLYQYMTNTPLMFRTFWGIVKPFIDPVTKEKIVFCSGKKSIELMKRDLHMNVLEKSAFGTETLRDYDSKEYFALPLDTVFDEKE